MSQANMPITSNTNDESICRVCGGENLCNHLGVIRHEVPVDHPDFGKLFRCPYNRAENDEERKARLRKLSNLDAFDEKTFGNFIVDLPMLSPDQLQSLSTAFNMAKRFADKPEGWLILEGTYGCGKTILRRQLVMSVWNMATRSFSSQCLICLIIYVVPMDQPQKWATIKLLTASVIANC